MEIQTEKKIKRGLSSKSHITLMVDGPEEYFESRKVVLLYFLEKKIKGIYISFDNSYDNIRESLEMESINSKNLLFIDATGASSEGKKEECVHIDDPNALTNLSVQLSHYLSKEKREFVLIDSLTTLLQYNDEPTCSRFLSYITMKLREKGAEAIIIGYEKETPPELNHHLN